MQRSGLTNRSGVDEEANEKTGRGIEAPREAPHCIGTAEVAEAYGGREELYGGPQGDPEENSEKT